VELISILLDRQYVSLSVLILLLELYNSLKESLNLVFLAFNLIDQIIDPVL